jgi:hypothetical protein
MSSLNSVQQKSIEKSCDITQQTEEPDKLNDKYSTSQENTSALLLVLYATISMLILFLLFR